MNQSQHQCNADFVGQASLHPSVWTDHSIVRSAPSKAILVPKLCVQVPTQIIKLSNPLAIFLDKPAETSSKITFSGESLGPIGTSPWKQRHHLPNLKQC